MGSRRERWIVVGGGVLGLVAAQTGVRAGHDVVLLEGAETLGGLTASTTMDTPDGERVTVDSFYHVFLESDAAVIALLDQLGLAESIRWSAAPAVVAHEGHQYPASALGELARLPVLTSVDRLRTGLSVAASLALPLPVARRLTAQSWLRRIAGPGATRAFWGPILRAKLGAAAPEVSADFLVATFRRLIRARLRGAGDRFGVVGGGYAPVIAALADQATQLGAHLRTGAAVRRISPQRPRGAARVAVELHSGERLSADKVVLTTPGPVTARLLPQLTARELQSLTGAPYLGVICGIYLMDRAPNDAYLTYLVDDVDITGVIGMHALLDPASTGGRALVYVPRYCAPDDPWFELDDAEVDARLRSAVDAALPGSMRRVAASAVSRARYVVPLPTPDAPRPLPVTTSVPGVYVVSGAQNTSGTANVEQTLEFAAPALRRVLREPAR